MEHPSFRLLGGRNFGGPGDQWVFSLSPLCVDDRYGRRDHADVSFRLWVPVADTVVLRFVVHGEGGTLVTVSTSLGVGPHFYSQPDPARTDSSGPKGHGRSTFDPRTPHWVRRCQCYSRRDRQ